MSVSGVTCICACLTVPFGGMMPGGLTGGMGMGRLQGNPLGGGTVLLVSNLEEEVRTRPVRALWGRLSSLCRLNPVSASAPVRCQPPVIVGRLPQSSAALKSIANTRRLVSTSLTYLVTFSSAASGRRWKR